MKKIVALVIMFCIFSVGAFAQVLSFDYSFWGRGVFTPVAFSEGYSSVSAATATWNNGAYPRLGFTMNAYNRTKTIGIKITSFWETGVPGIGEHAQIWVKPLAFLGKENLTDILELRIGKWVVEDFRGQIGAAEFGSWMVPDGNQDEDTFFNRFESNSGAHFTLRPLAWWDSKWNGLTLMGAVGSSYGGLRAYMNTWPWDAADVYLSGHYLLGYKIPDIGLFRVQFIGNNRQAHLEDYPYDGQNGQYRLMQGLLMNRDADVLEAAFTFTMVEGLKVEAGLKVPFFFETGLQGYQYYRAVYPTNTPYATSGSAAYGTHTVQMQLPINVSVGGTFARSGWDSLLRVDTGFGGRYNDVGYRDITEGMAVGVLGSVSYGVATNFRVGMDIGFNYKDFDTITSPNGTVEKVGERTGDIETSERMDLGFAPWAQFNLGGGRVRAGVAIMLPSSERWNYLGGSGTRPFTQVFTGAPVISIPISVTYSF